MTYLLDVNALIAAIWKDHADHAVTDVWIEGKSLAICPLSELGFLRVSTHPKAINAPMAAARRALENFLEANSPEFVPADLPALSSSPRGSDQVTDAYLAELAAKHKMKLATHDRRIEHAAVHIIA